MFTAVSMKGIDKLVWMGSRWGVRKERLREEDQIELVNFSLQI